MICKGRLIPNVLPREYFDKLDARSPFEGELNVSESSKDIYYWIKDDLNNWKAVSRTKEIQDYLDKYTEDTTFESARCFVNNGIIKRFYYDKHTQKCWLDESLDTSEYSYYAIKSISKINGVQKYITGYAPNDGLEYENSLIKISDKAQLTQLVEPNRWYIVEFYDEDKQYKYSTNYLSYPSRTMGITTDLKASSGVNINETKHRDTDARVIDFKIRFNQSFGDNKAYLYKGQNISDLKFDLVTDMGGKQNCIVHGDNESITVDGFDFDTNKLGVKNANVYFKYIATDGVNSSFKTETFEVGVYSSNPVTVSLEHSDSREYKSVKLRVIGEEETKLIENYELVTMNGVDSFIIPYEDLTLGQNIIYISYVDKCEKPLVTSHDLILSRPVTIEVIEDNYADIDQFIPVGYIEMVRAGLYKIVLKYFAHYTDGSFEDVTSKVEVIEGISESSFGVTQTSTVRIVVDHLKKVYKTFMFDVYCSDPNVIGNNDSRVIINGATPRALLYDGSKFTLGVVSGKSATVVALKDLLSSSALNVGGKPTHIRIREVEDSSKLFTKITCDETDLTYTDKIVIPRYISPSEDVSIGDLIKTLDHRYIDFYNFSYFSLNDSTVITEEQKTLVCEKNKQVFVIDKGIKYFLSEVHIKSPTEFAVSSNKPFLVEGFRKEDGRFISTGAIVHFAIQSY